MPTSLQETFACSPSKKANSYVYAIAPVFDDGLAAITSADEVVLLDRKTLQKAVEFESVPEVTCLKTDSANRERFFVAGRPGEISAFDARLKGKSSGFNVDRPVAALASLGTDLAVGTELDRQQAVVSVWDLRQNRCRWQNTENNDDITDLQFHPSKPTQLLSGGIDGLVSIFDISIADEDDSLLRVLNHGPIHHTGFLSDMAVYALSHDEQFTIFPMAELDDAHDSLPQILGDVRPILNCDYVIDVVRIGEDWYLGAGSNKMQQKLEFIKLEPGSDLVLTLEPTILIPGAHGEDIVRAVFVDSRVDTVYTAGEDGIVRAFKSSIEHQPADEVLPKAVPKTPKSARYKPY